jgi:hypothetical protein
MVLTQSRWGVEAREKPGFKVTRNQLDLFCKGKLPNPKANPTTNPDPNPNSNPNPNPNPHTLKLILTMTPTPTLILTPTLTVILLNVTLYLAPRTCNYINMTTDHITINACWEQDKKRKYGTRQDETRRDKTTTTQPQDPKRQDKRKGKC